MANARTIREVDVAPIGKDFNCSYCNNPANGYECNYCRSVAYCGTECEKLHWQDHKDFCRKIRKRRSRTERQAAPLRHYQWSYAEPINAFQTIHRGFWNLGHTNDYCCARMELAATLHKCGIDNNSTLALELATEHYLDLIWLVRGDRIGIRNILPFLYLDQNRYQEAYDFVKWWLVVDSDDDYDFENLDLPYICLQGENIHENLSELALQNHTSVTTLMALFLIKFKVANVIQTYIDEREENLKKFNLFLTDSNPVSRCYPATQLIYKYLVPHQKIEEEKLLPVLKQQIETLIRRIDKANKFLVPACIYPTSLLNFHPSFNLLSRGSPEDLEVEEAQSVIKSELHHHLNKSTVQCLTKHYNYLHGKDAVKTFKELNNNIFRGVVNS